MSLWVERMSCREVADYRDPTKYYVLVTRYYPMEFRKRGLKQYEAVDVWDRELAPSRELLKEFKENRDWKGYTQQFRKEKPLILIHNRISTHLKNAKGKPVVLVCQEEAKDYPHCHTWLILEIYERSCLRAKIGMANKLV